MSLLSPTLEAFLAVVKHRTVHGAASSLGITQTGVTQRIRSLESSLSTTLFTRSRRGMLLTNEGEALLRYCQGARDLEGAALSVIHKSGTETEVRVSLTGPTSMIESRIVPQCISVLKEFAQLVLSFDVDDIENRCEELRNGRAQFAIVPRDQVSRELDSKLLKPEKYVLVGSKAWKKRSIRDIVQTERIIDFDVTDQVTRAYLKKLGLLDLARPERHFINNNTALVRMFSEGVGYGVLSQEVALPFLTDGSLIVLHEGSIFQKELALAWYPRSEMPGYFKALVTAIK